MRSVRNPLSPPTFSGFACKTHSTSARFPDFASNLFRGARECHFPDFASMGLTLGFIATLAQERHHGCASIAEPGMPSSFG